MQHKGPLYTFDSLFHYEFRTDEAQGRLVCSRDRDAHRDPLCQYLSIFSVSSIANDCVPHVGSGLGEPVIATCRGGVTVSSTG